MESNADARPLARPATDYLFYVIFRLQRAMGRAFEAIALRNGLTQPEFLACLVLAEGHPLSNAQLARRTFVTSQASHEVVSSLLSRGLVGREDHRTNKRIRLISLTDEGWGVMEACIAELCDVEERTLAHVGGDERQALLPSLQRAAETLAGGYFGDEGAESEAFAHRMHKGGF